MQSFQFSDDVAVIPEEEAHTNFNAAILTATYDHMRPLEYKLSAFFLLFKSSPSHRL